MGSFDEVTWEYKGVILPKDVAKETMDAMANFQIRDDDIVVASYPKTGTNWLLEIIRKIQKAAGKTEHNVVFTPMEMTAPTATQPGYITLADMPSPRLMATHLPIQFVPPGVSKPQNKNTMSFEKLSWEYKGTHFPRDITKETLDAMPDFQIRDDDIVVASFPKTGTNWLAEIVVKILRAAGKTESSADMLMAPGPMEMKIPTATQPGYVTIADMPSPRLVVTHLPIQFAPKGISKPQNKVKVLVPMRNPKDTAVSLYHFANKVMKMQGKTDLIPWEVFADKFTTGKSPFGQFDDHVLGWWQMRDDPHFLFLKYEDMKKDLLSAVKTIVAFLEVDLDETTIKGIAEASTFNNMKTDLDNSKTPERQAIARKGIIGDWKNMFSAEQSKAFDAWYEEKFSGTGIIFDFE